MTSATERRIRILQLLPRRAEGTVTVPQLAQWLAEQGIEVDDRTLQRDMLDLSSYCPITCDESTKPYQWYWFSSETLPIPAMGQFTALTFQLAEEVLKPLLPAQCLQQLQPNFTTARRLLNERSRTRARRWLDKVRIVPRSLRFRAAPIRPGIYQTVTEALYDDRQLEIRYLAASSKTGRPLTYAVHPYALLHRDATTELVGRIEGDDTVRRWLLHRIRKARRLDTAARIPQGFDLDDYINHTLAYPLSGKPITLRAWLRDDVQTRLHVQETPLSDDQTLEHTDDGLILTARLRESIELKWWILGLGERIRILEPDSLREEIRRTLAAASRLYESDQPATGETAS